MATEKIEAAIERHLMQKVGEDMSQEDIELLKQRVQTIRELSE